MKSCISDKRLWECEYMGVLRGKVCGVMDAEPDEYYCTYRGDDYFFGDDENDDEEDEDDE